MSEASSFWQHVVQASLPVLKICMLGSVGALLAACGVLDQQGRRTLSKLIYFLFTPCLTFSKLAPVLTAQHLLLWMPIAVNMFLSVGVGLVLGVLLLLVVGAPSWFRKHVIVSTALGNAGNLPLVLVAALLQESGGVLFKYQDVSVDLSIAYVAMGIWAATITHFTVGTHMLKLPAWQQDQSSSSSRVETLKSSTTESATACERQQLQHHSKECGDVACQAKSVLVDRSSADGSVMGSEWAEGAATCSVELMSSASFSQSNPVEQHQQHEQEHEQHENMHEQTGSSDSTSFMPDATMKQWLQQQQQQQQQQCHHHPREGLQSTWPTKIARFLSRPMSLQQHRQQQQSFPDLEHGEFARLLSSSQYSTSSSCGATGDHLRAGSASVLPSQLGRPSPSFMQQHHQQQQQGTGNIPQQGYCSSSSGSNAWTSFAMLLQDAAIAAGRVLWAQTSPPMVGCMLAVLVGMTAVVRDQLFEPGGHLLMIQDCINMFSDCCIPCLLLMMGATLSKGPGKSCPPWRVVVGVSAARLVVMPLLGTGWIVLAQRTGWLAAPDSMFSLVMLIQNAVPTALNVHTLATLHGNREEEVGALLFWQYLAACITVPGALMFFLWLLKTPTMAVTAAGV